MVIKQRTLKNNLDVLQQKARERTVKTQNVEYDLETLVKRIKKKSIKLDPDYQRRHRWSAETSSRLIESLILNIPIPVIFLSQDVDVDEETEDSTARYTVIDGQQRLTAIYDYLRDQFPLEGLETLSELNGAFYRDLPPFLVRRLEERTVKCMRIDSTVDAQVKFDIFERLNTGSVRLESQELRNATARGPFNDAIKEMAKFAEFRSMIQVPENDPASNSKVQKMEDVELVLRFFALRDGRYKTLKKGFREFLTTSLIQFNDWSDQEIDQGAWEFGVYMRFIYENAEDLTPFAKFRRGGKRMSTFNAAVFDAVAVGIAEVFSAADLDDDPDEAAQALEGYRELFEDENFFAAVSGSVNDGAKVVERIDAMVAHLGR
ncbi:DUF262 domain-containing protein [Devosia sp. Leaf64]|uniref:GmrSD restriction endonuclease domain-containing protein n=1 Tax=Devosia sp. Leaf64 TaxID=1736229 RepID=UPI000A3FDC3B|nr:DUF262 domain-containing protein [Devosia sp. Leaf64]